MRNGSVDTRIKVKDAINNIKTVLERFHYVQLVFIEIPMEPDTEKDSYREGVKNLPVTDLKMVPHKQEYLEYLDKLSEDEWDNHRVSAIQLRKRMLETKDALQNKRPSSVQTPDRNP